MPLKTFTFTKANTPLMRRISVHQGGTFDKFQLNLPHLESLSFEHTHVYDSRSFGPSLNKCPKLKTLSCYKLWGLSGTTHKLRVPEAETLDFYRSDDLEGLELWAPKLTMLGLRACYALDHVRLMADPPGQKPSGLTVNMINANINRESKRHLKQHPGSRRCGRARSRSGAACMETSSEAAATWE